MLSNQIITISKVKKKKKKRTSQTIYQIGLEPYKSWFKAIGTFGYEKSQFINFSLTTPKLFSFSTLPPPSQNISLFGEFISCIFYDRINLRCSALNTPIKFTYIVTLNLIILANDSFVCILLVNENRCLNLIGEPNVCLRCNTFFENS